MEERIPSSTLDPYCPKCGMYKGIGECSSQSCKEETAEKKSQNYLNTPRCNRCTEIASIKCSRCGNGYCMAHARFSDSCKIESFTQSIGTCSNCGQIVCENCWILDDAMIQCLIHLEISK